MATGGAFMDPLEPDAHTSKPSLSRGILLLWLLVPLVGLIVSLYLALT